MHVYLCWVHEMDCARDGAALASLRLSALLSRYMNEQFGLVHLPSEVLILVLLLVGPPARGRLRDAATTVDRCGEAARIVVRHRVRLVNTVSKVGSSWWAPWRYRTEAPEIYARMHWWSQGRRF